MKPFIPQDACWYLAEHVQAIAVSGRQPIVVHLNTVLVRADSPAEAHRRAVQLGRQGNTRYRNSAGERVSVRFLGLRQLAVIHEPLDHGAELTWAQRKVASIDQARRLTRTRAHLAVFAPRRRTQVSPDAVEAGMRKALDLLFPAPPRRRRARAKA